MTGAVEEKVTPDCGPGTVVIVTAYVPTVPDPSVALTTAFTVPTARPVPTVRTPELLMLTPLIADPFVAVTDHVYEIGVDMSVFDRLEAFPPLAVKADVVVVVP